MFPEARMKIKLHTTQIILYIKIKSIQLYEDMISLKTDVIANILGHLNDQINWDIIGGKFVFSLRLQELI